MLNDANLPEIIFASSDSTISKQIGILLSEGRIRKMVQRVYTANLLDDLEAILERNLLYIIGHLYPDAVVSHRSAFEIRPSPKHNIYLTYKYTKNIQLLHLSVKLIKGSGATDKDNRLNEKLYLSSFERACLENLQSARKGPDGERRTVEREVIEKRLIDILKVEGEKGLNTFRDATKVVAEELDFNKEFEQFNRIISALLSTKSSKSLKSPLAIATALGQPYDSYRIGLFWELFAALKSQSFNPRLVTDFSSRSFENFAFFEAYFSNYIEGTQFEVEEAKEILFDGVFIENRMGDTHDIKGTYEIVSSQYEMQKIPNSYEELIDLLQTRHQIIMTGRPDMSPGKFKTKANRAGNTTFVEPTLVRGTLKKAFEPFQALDQPLARAIFMMFMISEIHPFEDGNGRIARVMMNAELVNANATRIIIPTVYREDYLLALRKLTRKKMADAYIKMMDRAHEFSHSLPTKNFDILLERLQRSNAFFESDEAMLKIL